MFKLLTNYLFILRTLSVYKFILYRTFSKCVYIYILLIRLIYFKYAFICNNDLVFKNIQNKILNS